MTRTAFIAAMPGELKPLVRGWKHQRRNGVDLWLHRDDNLYVAACAGAGQAAATRAFAEVEKEAPVDLAFSLGWAGALRSGIAPGSVHNMAGVIDTRTGERFRCDAESGELWLVTSPIVADAAEKLRLAETYAASLVDMEAAAIARLAVQRGIPFYAIKAVSDALDERLPDLNAFLTPDGRFRTARFTLYALMRPWYWSALARMGENSKKAAGAIRDAVSDFLDERA
ncbi:MAG TPA: nucleoside phosphorylase [Terracidiphilus sp.]